MRLKGTRSFQRVLRTGMACGGPVFRLHVLRSPGVTRVGIVVGRRFGKAVHRNRIKRRLREVVRRHRQVFADMELIVRPREVCRQLDAAQLEQALLRELAEGRRSEVQGWSSRRST